MHPAIRVSSNKRVFFLLSRREHWRACRDCACAIHGLLQLDSAQACGCRNRHDAGEDGQRDDGCASKTYRKSRGARSSNRLRRRRCAQRRWT